MKRLPFLICSLLLLFTPLFSQASSKLTVVPTQVRSGPPPECFFQYTADATEAGLISFNDLSLYHPHSWQWHFGDGGYSTSGDTEYRYEENGTYEVCLTVTNDSGSDTECVNIIVDAISNTINRRALAKQLQVFPNPARGQFVVSTEITLTGSLQLKDSRGALVLEQLVAPGTDTWSFITNDLPGGVYYIHGQDDHGHEFIRKLLIQQ